MTKLQIAKNAKRRRAKILAQRGKGWTLAKIAAAHGGITTARVSAILVRAKADLRSPD